MLQTLVESSKFPMKQHSTSYITGTYFSQSTLVQTLMVNMRLMRLIQDVVLYNECTLDFPCMAPSLWNGSSISSPSMDIQWIFRCQQVTGLEALWMPHGPDQGAGPMVSGT